MTSSGSSGGSRRLEDGNWEALDVGALSSRGHRAEVRLTRSSRDLEQNVHYFGRKFEGIDIRKIMDQVSFILHFVCRNSNLNTDKRRWNC